MKILKKKKQKEQRIRILPYKGGSAAAKALSKSTGILRATRFYRPKPGDLIINWGCSDLLWPKLNYINHPVAVNTASSKLLSLQALSAGGVNVPEFTVNRNKAQEWINSGKRIVARTLDRASGGRGIVLVSLTENGGKLPQARLYTLYRPKYDEYRLHVWGKKVIDVQQKRKRKETEEINNQIRNADNGWVFCREGIKVPDQVIEQALKAVEVLGLDFGAVDIGYTRKGEIATVYEVNTAPGLEGTTLEIYSECLKKIINECN